VDPLEKDGKCLSSLYMKGSRCSR